MQLNPDSVISKIMRVFSIYSVFPLKKKNVRDHLNRKTFCFSCLFPKLICALRIQIWSQCALILSFKLLNPYLEREYVNQSKNIGMLRHSVMTMHLFGQEFTA